MVQLEALLDTLRRDDPVEESEPPAFELLAPRIFGCERPAPRRRLRARPHATPIGKGPALLLGGVGATAIAVLITLLVTASGTPGVAFAGWTRQPTEPAPREVRAAEAICRHDSPLASSPATLVDTRGPYTLLVYTSGGSADCIVGPGFDSAHGTHVLPLGRRLSATSIVPGTVRPRKRAGVSLAADHERSEYGFMVGETGAGVTAVSLVLADGRDVQATVGGGWYAAWWPGGEEAARAVVQSSTGTIDERLIPPRGYETSGYRAPWEPAMK